MKKIQILFLFMLIFSSVHSQEFEWIVYSTPSLMYKNLQGNYFLPIAINGDKQFGVSINSKKYDGINLIVSNYSNSWFLPDNFILSLVQDGIGNIWIGTYYGGLAKFDGTNWMVYNTSNSGLPNNTIYSLAKDGKGNLWIGTTSGLVKYDGTNWTVYNTSNSGLPNNIIYSLAIDGKGNKWIGTLAGLVKYDGKKWILYNRSNSRLPDNSVTSLMIDKKGYTWIGTFAGLAKFDGIKWSVFNTSNSRLPFNDIYSISLDGSGGILIETWGGGLAEYNGKTWSVYNTSNSNLPDNNISSLVIDNKGNKWIGTLEGLAKLNGKKWTVYNTSNSSLPDNMIYSLFYDRSGNLWIGTKNGLAIFKEGGITPLQADLTTFNAEARRNKIYLIWRTATETNNYGFEVERKTNYSSWDKIGSVLRYRNSNSQEGYTFVDKDPISGNVSYRIKKMYFDRKNKYSQIVDTLIEKPSDIILGDTFPNLFQSKTRISFSLPKSCYTKVEVYNSLGERIAELINKELRDGFHEVEFDGTNVNSGICFLRITTDNFTTIKAMLLTK